LETFTAAFIDESFFDRLSYTGRVLYFIGDLRGQNKADIDALLEKYEEFFNGNTKK
jgi:ABC-2 type transport system ATP-binding protein